MGDVNQRASDTFLDYYQKERRRADQCISDICDVLLDPFDDTILSEREEITLAKIIAYLKREPPYA